MKQIITLDKEQSVGLFDPTVKGGTFLRTDNVQHRVLKDLWEKSNALFWTVKMIDFDKDALEPMQGTPGDRMFKLNNGYQSLMDSGVVGLYNHLALLTTNTEVALSYQQIAFMESIHATSYSDGLVQMFGYKASEVIDTVYTDPVVRTRLESEIDFSDQMIINPTERNIALAIAAVYALEAIKFPFSFFVTLTLNKAYGNCINGFAQLISRIALDELDIHVPTNKYVLKQLIKQGVIEIEAIASILDAVLSQELKWNEYLQQDGPIVGYNQQIGEEFIRYKHNKALRDLGMDLPKLAPNDTIQWFNHVRMPDNKQVSQQEMKSSQYQKGVMKNDLHKLDAIYGAINVE